VLIDGGMDVKEGRKKEKIDNKKILFQSSIS